MHNFSYGIFHFFKMPGNWLSRERKRFMRGDIYRNVLKPIITAKLQEAANPTTSMGGQGAYRRRYIKRRRTYKGRGMYTGGGMYTGSGVYRRPTRYTGRGAYTPAANAIVTGPSGVSSKSSQNIVPIFNPVDRDTVEVSRREYVSEIYGPPLKSGTTVPEPFAIQTYSINPGLERTFRWLSQIAQNFDEYELLQCIFTFKSTTTESGNQVNGQVGTVIMATNYNSAAPAFREKNTMMQYAGSVSSRLTETCIHGVECDPRKLAGSVGNYVRSNPVVSGQDLKTYDHGLFQIAIANCSDTLANQSLGELWVSYTVRLRKPKFFTALGLGITKDIFKRNNTETITQGQFGPFMGTNYLQGQQNNLGCKYEDVAGAISSVKIVNPFTGVLGSALNLGAGAAFRITFPAAYSGNIKVMWACEVDPNVTGALVFATFINNSSGAGQSSPTNASNWLWAGTGNIRGIRDLYGAYDNTYDDLAQAPGFEMGSSTGTGALIIGHFQVDIATNGVDNVLYLYFGPQTGGAGYVPPDFKFLKDCYLEVGEYNAGFSYSATGLGVTDQPVWKNQAGVIVNQS